MNKCGKCGREINSFGLCAEPACSPEVKVRKGMKYKRADSTVNRIVSLMEFKGNLYLATERRMYVKVGDDFIPMRFDPADDESDPADFWKEG